MQFGMNTCTAKSTYTQGVIRVKTDNANNLINFFFFFLLNQNAVSHARVH